MIGLTMLELLVMVLAVYGFVTQVGLPAWRGTPLFPVFEGKEARLLREREQVAQEARELALQRDIAALRKRNDEESKTVDTPEPVRAYRMQQRDDEGGDA